MRFTLTLAALLLTSQLVAQQATPTNPNQSTDPAIRTGTPSVPTNADRTVRPGTFRDSAAHGQQKAVRASQIIGTNVKNKANEDLGSINDLVFDPMDGRIAYVAVSMGGFLGVGDKLFAVPWDAIECREVNGKHVTFLNIDKKTLENAQGFDQEHWPDMANERWRTENDRPYQSLRRRSHETYRPIQQPGAQQPGPQQPGTQPLPAQPPQQQ